MRDVAGAFPVRARPGQVEAAEALTRLLESSSRVVFIAPPGFGKTLVALVSLKVLGLLPAAWRVRALTLTRRVADDAALLDLRVELLPGRERVCPHALTLGGDIHEWCRFYRHECAYFTQRSCPYFFHPLADVYVLHYQRRPPPRLIDVWDEAHNLLAPREVCVGPEEIREAAGELRAVDPEVAREVLSLLTFLEREGGVPVSEELVARIYAAYVKLLREGRTATGRVYRVLSSQSVYSEQGRLCGARLLLRTTSTKALLVSATLPFASHLGAVVEVPWARKYRAVVIDAVTTRYSDFDEGMVREYGKLLWEVRKKHRRVLVFATRRVAERLKRFVDFYEPVEIPADWRGTLLLLTRGRWSEGVDLRADAVVIAGAPYLPPWALDRLERELKRAGFSFAEVADVTMLSTVLQCVGRATRSPEDSPLILLADKRFKNLREELEKYFHIEEST